MPAWQVHELPVRGAFRRTDRGAGKSGTVVVASENQRRNLDAPGEAARPVEADSQCRAGGYLLAPAWASIARVERSIAVQSIGGRDR
jgi:hypothetical protein